MSSGALQPVRLAAQAPRYTPLPRPAGLGAVTSLGDAPQGHEALDEPPVMVNYKTKTGMDTWYSDRKATKEDCQYLCEEDPKCLESSFDAALGLTLVAPSCASSVSAWYLRCCDGEEEGQSGPRANVLGRFGKTTNAR